MLAEHENVQRYDPKRAVLGIKSSTYERVDTKYRRATSDYVHKEHV